jgi:putative salt-induced outer membrane protein
MKKTIATIIVAAGTTVALAQTSTSSVPATNAPPKPKWVSSVSMGASLTRGNSDTTLLTTKALTDWKAKMNELSFGADAAYGESDGTENVETLHGFGQWNHLFTDRFYGYARAEGLHDGIADVDYRATVGPGAGYYLLKETNTTLAVEGGGSVVFERQGGADSSYATLRFAERFEHKFSEYGARIWQNVEFLPQVDDFNNYIINAEIGIEASIAKDLTLQAYVDDSYNNQPAPDRQKNDVKLVSAISYKF